MKVERGDTGVQCKDRHREGRGSRRGEGWARGGDVCQPKLKIMKKPYGNNTGKKIKNII